MSEEGSNAASAAAKVTDAGKVGPTPPAARISGGVRMPLTFSESFKQWWNRKDLQTVEENVFKCAGIETKAIDVPVGKNLFINELELVGPKLPDRENKHIVLIHGYGACKGFFYKNIAYFGSLPGYTLHALDLLGYGRSTRPKFRIDADNPIDGVLKAESFFVDSLEAWRAERGIPKFSLIAHSLGAYVGFTYTQTHASRVDSLVMVSPAAVTRQSASIPFEDIQARFPEEKLQKARLVPTKFVPPRWFEYLWDRNCSPFSIVRMSGPWGPKFASWWSSRTFRNFPQPDQDALQKYAYAMFNARGSGEYALSYLLAVGAQGRWPLAERVSNIPCDSLWVYGDRDWMDIGGGYEAADRIRAQGKVAEVVEIRDAGHHIYLDNAKDFNALVKSWLDRHDK